MANPKGLTTEEQIKTASILHAIEVKSSFELYAYRIIGHEQYIERITDLVKLFDKTVKQARKPDLKKITPNLNVDSDGQISIAN